MSHIGDLRARRRAKGRAITRLLTQAFVAGFVLAGSLLSFDEGNYRSGVTIFAVFAALVLLTIVSFHATLREIIQ